MSCFERGPENLVSTWNPSSAGDSLTGRCDSTERSERMRQLLKTSKDCDYGLHRYGLEIKDNKGHLHVPKF